MGDKRKFKCYECKHVWEETYGTGKPPKCIECGSTNIHRVDTGPGGAGKGRSPAPEGRGKGGGDSVGELISGRLISATPEDTISRAAGLMRGNNISSLLVKEKGEFIGIVSEKDIINKVVAEELYPRDVKVREIMNRPLITIPERETIEKAAELMKKKGVRRLAVTEGGRIVGLLSETDITRQLKKL